MGTTDISFIKWLRKIVVRKHTRSHIIWSSRAVDIKMRIWTMTSINDSGGNISFRTDRIKRRAYSHVSDSMRKSVTINMDGVTYHARCRCFGDSIYFQTNVLRSHFSGTNFLFFLVKRQIKTQHYWISIRIHSFLHTHELEFLCVNKSNIVWLIGDWHNPFENNKRILHSAIWYCPNESRLTLGANNLRWNSISIKGRHGLIFRSHVVLSTLNRLFSRRI